MIKFISDRKHHVTIEKATVAELKNYLLFNKGRMIALDTETTGLDPYTSKILLIIIGDAETQYVIDRSGILADDLNKVGELICQEMVLGHHIKFDYKMCKAQLGWEFREMYDTMVAEQRLVMGATAMDGVRVGLEPSLNRRLGITLPQPKSTRNEFLGMNEKSLFEDRHIEYAAGDVGHLFALRAKQQEIINRYDQQFLIDLEMKLIPILGDMELEGMVFNSEAWAKRIDEDYFTKLRLEQEMDEEIRKIAEKDSRVLGGKYTRKRNHYTVEQLGFFGESKKTDSKNAGNINYGSSAQILEIFNRLELLPPTDSSGKGTLAADQVKQWLLDAPETNPLYHFVELYQEYTKMKKAVSSYGESWVRDFVNPVTGKVHTEFWQCGTRTGRLSCGNTKEGKPNFQQMPRSDAYRNCFGTRPGYKIVGCDLGGAELVILAAISRDKKLFDLVRGDMHSYLATACWREIYRYRGDKELARTFTVSKDENKDKRQVQKNVNYGLTYGASAKRISETLGITLEEGEIVEQTIKNELPDAFGYLDRKAKEGLEQGYIVLCDRTKSRRWFPDVLNAKKTKKRLSKYESSKVGRLSKNAPIQGCQADMIKESMVEIDSYIRANNVDAFILLTIHDELQVAYREDLDWFPAEVARIMTEVANRYLCEGIVMSADFDTGYVWKK